MSVVIVGVSAIMLFLLVILVKSMLNPTNTKIQKKTWLTDQSFCYRRSSIVWKTNKLIIFPFSDKYFFFFNKKMFFSG